MKLNGSISNKIFDELMTTVEVIGIDRTIKTLQDAKANSLILDDLNILLLRNRPVLKNGINTWSSKAFKID